MVDHIAFLKDQGRISLHILDSAIFLAQLIENNVQLFNSLKLRPFQIQMHLNDFPGLLGDNVVELPREIL